MLTWIFRVRLEFGNRDGLNFYLSPLQGVNCASPFSTVKRKKDYLFLAIGAGIPYISTIDNTTIQTNTTTMKKSPSNTEIAESYHLWAEYVDPAGIDSEAEFLEMPVARRLEIMRDCGMIGIDDAHED